MRLAIMQPYLFPYVGYFQLVNTADVFVVYDDVTFIKQGWINRNNILLNGKPHLFTVPLLNASSYQLIHNTDISQASNWIPKFLKTIQQAYQKAPYFKIVFPLIEQIVYSEQSNIASLASNSIQKIAEYIGLNTSFISSSRIYNNQDLTAQDRVVDICQKEQAEIYINPIGGLTLYNKADFKEQGIDLFFIKSKSISYQQYNNDFVPNLSIIDVLMFNAPSDILKYTNQFELV
jgi:hypothetical protein